MSWPADKSPADFRAVAANLRLTGQSSRADCVDYLIDRLEACELFIGDLAEEIERGPQPVAPNTELPVPSDLAGIYARARDLEPYWDADARHRSVDQWNKGYARGAAVTCGHVREFLTHLNASFRRRMTTESELRPSQRSMSDLLQQPIPQGSKKKPETNRDPRDQGVHGDKSACCCYDDQHCPVCAPGEKLAVRIAEFTMYSDSRYRFYEGDWYVLARDRHPETGLARWAWFGLKADDVPLELRSMEAMF